MLTLIKAKLNSSLHTAKHLKLILYSPTAISILLKTNNNTSINNKNELVMHIRESHRRMDSFICMIIIKVKNQL